MRVLKKGVGKTIVSIHHDVKKAKIILTFSGETKMMIESGSKLSITHLKSNQMTGKYPINSSRIDGIQLLEDKFPSFTKRQICQLYGIATVQCLSLEDIKHVYMTNPLAKIGESFGISIETKNSDYAKKS